MTARLAILAAAALGAAGVGLGAYQAHGLEQQLVAWELPKDQVERRLHNADVAVRFQILHALALVGVGVLAQGRASSYLVIAAMLFTSGVVLFSGGLYTIVLYGPLLPAAIVPVGGLMLILGWLFLGGYAAFGWDSNPVPRGR